MAGTRRDFRYRQVSKLSDSATATPMVAQAAARCVRWTAPHPAPRRGDLRRASQCSASSNAEPMVTRDEIAAAAKRRGLTLDTKTFGPFFKITARRVPARAGEPVGDADVDVIGEHDGFIAPPPFGILHMDSMRIYNSRVRGDDERRKMRSVFGISILLGATSALMAHESGCEKVELLAIDDGNEYAQKLVNYYTRLGFEAVRVVGEGASTDLADMLVWGGAGTRMNGNLPELLRKWGAVVRRQAMRDDA